MYYSENSFRSASSRDVVEEANFIGRAYDLKQIENRIILPSPERQRGSIAIIGLPDVGKHCLINQALLARKKDLHQQNLVPIEIDLITYTGPDKHDKFFRDLISLCKYELEDEDFLFATSKINNLIQMTKDILREWDEGAKTISPLKRFFSTLQRADIRVIFILNNFDHADSLFKEHIARIRWLRDLASSQCQVTWIALACKPIRDIKRLPKSISDDFFYEHRLGMFMKEDMEVYFRSLTQMGVSLTKEHEKTITAYCGRHPYLLSLLGYHLVEDYAHQSSVIDVQQALHKVEERFCQSYDRIIDLVLVNDGNDEKLRKLWHLLFDPEAGIEQKDIDRMLAYDLISHNLAWSPAQENTQSAYVAFSEHFQIYLRSKLLSSESPSILEGPEEIFQPDDLLSWSQSHSTSSMLVESIPPLPAVSFERTEHALTVFFSYSNEDEALRKELEKHLRSLQHQRLIDMWYDHEISAGTEWKRQIATHLNTAQVILLLVSPDFMGSDYCYSQEMKRAIERHESGEARVIPILLRPVYYEGAPFEKLQMLPANGKPITSWPHRDEAFEDVAKGISKAVKELTSTPARFPSADKRSGS